MKKLLILLMVLGLASAANAASCTLTLTINGQSEYDPTDGLNVTVDLTINITASSIYDNADNTGGMDFVQSMTAGSATFSLGDWIPSSSLESVGTLSGGNIVDAYWYKLGTDPKYPADTIIYSFPVTLTSDALGTISPAMGFDDRVVSGLTAYLASENTYVPVNIVPEPMTIMLLGLGGLFLRRRK